MDDSLPRTLGKLLLVLGKAISNLSDDDLDKILKEESCEIIPPDGKPRGGSRRTTRKAAKESYSVENIAAELDTLQDEELGRKLLQTRCTSRAHLEAVARQCGLVRIEGDMKALRDKIVEKTIGRRLDKCAYPNLAAAAATAARENQPSEETRSESGTEAVNATAHPELPDSTAAKTEAPVLPAANLPSPSSTEGKQASAASSAVASGALQEEQSPSEPAKPPQ